MTQKKRKPAAKASSKPGTGRPAVSAPGGPSAAQKRLAAQRAMAAASGAQAARRKRMLSTVVAPILVVVVVVGIFVAVKASSSSGSKAGNAATAATSTVVQAVTSVPATALNAVGAGSISAAPTALTGAALTQGGLPRVLYVGAEWCPYCAAERWPLAVALSRFGTFDGLGETSSSPSDVDPNTATLSFHGATYTSPYLVLSANEIQDGNHKTIETLPAADETLFTTVGGGSFPFLDIGGKYLSSASYDPATLKGKTHEQIAAALTDPTSAIAKAIDGSANVLTAAICTLTKNAPSDVCTSTGVVAAAKKLPNG